MNRHARVDEDLSRLADQYGLVVAWTDARGRRQTVSPDTLRALLGAAGVPCHNRQAVRDSLELVHGRKRSRPPALITGELGYPVIVPGTGAASGHVEFEHGNALSSQGIACGDGNIVLPAITQPGYHTLDLDGSRHVLAIAPRCAPGIHDLGGPRHPRAWGLTAQVYSLRRHRERHQPVRNEDGAGDYAALAELALQAGRRGANALAISPVHALFTADPARISPYSPSSRLFLNTSYINAESVLGPAAVERARMHVPGTVAASAQDDLIAWPQLVETRLALWRAVHRDFTKNGDPRHRESYRRFLEEGGAALDAHACYEVLHAHFSRSLGPGCGWQDWPSAFHDPRSPAVLERMKENAEALDFHRFLQWLAAEGMRASQAAAKAAGMSMGLISDLAIGTDPRGSHAWTMQNAMLPGVSVGAPPDVYQAQGQNWGLTAFSPMALVDQCYAPFLGTLRAALRHAGGVRIDHILGLQRLWLIPPGAAPTEGAYMRYPFQDMLRLLVLEAWRHRALILGENLGTVPPGFNDELYRKGILGTSVLWFEREDAGPADKASGPRYRPPERWAACTVSTTTTHDLPTINGWWDGRDLRWRAGGPLEVADGESVSHRLGEKKALWKALREAGCLHREQPEEPPRHAPREAILSYVARTPTPLMLAPIEDLLGLHEQPNLPGTSGTAAPFHPNWRRRFPLSAEDFFAVPGVRGCIAAIQRARATP